MLRRFTVRRRVHQRHLLVYRMSTAEINRNDADLSIQSHTPLVLVYLFYKKTSTETACTYTFNSCFSGKPGLVTLESHCPLVHNPCILLGLVLCEYSKFRIESNSYFSIRIDSKRAQLFQIFEYLQTPISYLFNRMMPIFHLSNHT